MPADGHAARPLVATPIPAGTNPVLDFITAAPSLALPDVAAMGPEHVVTAAEAVVAAQRQALAAIVAEAAEPTLVNTTIRIDQAKEPAFRLQALMRLLESNLQTDQLAAALAEASELLVRAKLDMLLDGRLFARLEAVPTADLNPEDKRHHELLLGDFVRAGVRLDETSRTRVAELSARLDRLEKAFARRLAADTAALAVGFDDPAELTGLPEPAVAAAADRAAADRAAADRSSGGSTASGAEGTESTTGTDRPHTSGPDSTDRPPASGPDSTDRPPASGPVGEDGTAGADRTHASGPAFLLPLLNFTQQPALRALTSPAARRRVLEHALARGARGGADDTRELVTELTAGRAELAALLGYRSYAAYIIDDETADSPDAVGDLLSGVLDPARRAFDVELAAIEQLGGTAPAPADVVFGLAQVTAARFDIDAQQIAAYFPLDRVLSDGVLYAASQLYGVDFRPARDEDGAPVRAWHPDVRVIDAFEHERRIGRICFDPFARTGKRGGAWMDQLISPGRLTGAAPLITMTMNITAPAGGAPALLSLDEVRTLFHEFGHVLHGLFSDSTYPDRAGTAVPRDYVEFPSQLNEMWALHPQVLPHYAAHVETGEPLPAELVERIRAAADFGSGFDTLEYLAAALLDQSWHLLESGERVDDVLTFEAAVLDAAGIPALVPPRYRSTYFSHIFAGGYAAGYYAYLRAEMLAAHTTEWFDAAGGLNPQAGAALRRAVLAPGFSRDPMEAFTDFFGQAPSIEPLLRRRGFAPPLDAPVPAVPEAAGRFQPAVPEATDPAPEAADPAPEAAGGFQPAAPEADAASGDDAASDDPTDPQRG